MTPEQHLQRLQQEENRLRRTSDQVGIEADKFSREIVQLQNELVRAQRVFRVRAVKAFIGFGFSAAVLFRFSTTLGASFTVALTLSALFFFLTAGVTSYLLFGSIRGK